MLSGRIGESFFDALRKVQSAYVGPAVDFVIS